MFRSTRCRFAPTPSGALHVGSARTFIAAYLQAKSLGAALVLRIEDLDIARTRAGAAQRMLDDLRWLGLRWDEGPADGPHRPYYQSQRGALYQAALNTLRAKGLVYPCSCSRVEVQQATQAPHQADHGPVYPGTCANRDEAEVLAHAARYQRKCAWRFRASSDWVSFADAVLGEYSENVASTVGDFVIARGDGVASYQLAVVVDDIAMGISHVLRAKDLHASTARQLLLYRAFEAEAPAWAHVGLVTDDDHRRLAKRDGGLSIAVIRDHGVPSAWLLERLLQSLGASSLDDRAFAVGPALERSVTLSELGLQNLQRELRAKAL